MSTLSVSSIKPLAGYVLVEPAAAETKTASGIFLPGKEDEKPLHGTVLAVGPAVIIDGHKVEPPVKKNDTVLYKKWGGNEVKVQDKEYQLLKFDDLLAILG